MDRNFISVGDDVVVGFNCDQEIVKGKVVAKPCEGDELWYIEKENGSILAVNPYSHNFDTIFKESHNG